MTKYVPVKGHSGLVRDTESNALINLNASEIEQARERKRLKIEKRQDEMCLKSRVETMESELTEIKSMLKILINKI